MLSWIGMLEIAFDFPVIRSVSSEISCLTAAAWDKIENQSSVSLFFWQKVQLISTINIFFMNKLPQKHIT